MLNSCLWHVHTLGVVHLKRIEVIIYKVGAKERLLSLVDLANVWVLPLEAYGLFCPVVSILLDSLEYSGSELSFETG